MVAIRPVKDLGPKKPKHYEELLAIWESALAERIGVLLKTNIIQYARNQLYRSRTFSNNDKLHRLVLADSKFPSESELQITHYEYSSKARPANHSGDMDVRGIQDLDVDFDA
jgi:hypothetical protein